MKKLDWKDDLDAFPATDPQYPQDPRLSKLRKALDELLCRCEGDCGWAYDDEPAFNSRNQRMLKRLRKVYTDTATAP